MKKLRLIWLILLIVCCVGGVFAQECNELNQLIEKVYNFKPSKLTASEQNTKSLEMDKVWSLVKSNKTTLLPCLIEAIKSPKSDNYFKFDGSNLLISLDQSSDSKQILIDAYSKVDLNDVDLSYWMRYISVLGYEGFDTSKAGENWLKTENPKYYLPQHGTLAVDKKIGAVIIFGSMEEKFATPTLLKLALQKENIEQDLIVELLISQTTQESFEALRTLDLNNFSTLTQQKIKDLFNKPILIIPRPEPKTSRQTYLEAFNQLTLGKFQPFMLLASTVSDGERDVVAVMKEEDVPLIRKSRRIFMLTANPHTAEWYENFTKILLTMNWKSFDTSKRVITEKSN